MATHNNYTLSQDYVRKFKLKTGDMGSVEVADTVPVTQIIPVVQSVDGQTAATGTLTLTLPTGSNDQKFYCTGVQLSFEKSGTNDVATGQFRILGLQQGKQICLATLQCSQYISESELVSNQFTIPVMLDAGSTVTWAMTYTAGTANRALVVFGYLE